MSRQTHIQRILHPSIIDQRHHHHHRRHHSHRSPGRPVDQDLLPHLHGSSRPTIIQQSQVSRQSIWLGQELPQVKFESKRPKKDPSLVFDPPKSVYGERRTITCDEPSSINHSQLFPLPAQSIPTLNNRPKTSDFFRIRELPSQPYTPHLLLGSQSYTWARDRTDWLK